MFNFNFIILFLVYFMMTYAKCVVKAKSFVPKTKFKFKFDQNDNSQATECEVAPSCDCNEGT